jgi:hypothetical protein
MQYRYRLRWVGGVDYFLEIPWADMNGNDVGISRDASLMDEDAKIIVCEKTPGWLFGLLIRLLFDCCGCFFDYCCCLFNCCFV